MCQQYKRISLVDSMFQLNVWMRKNMKTPKYRRSCLRSWFSWRSGKIIWLWLKNVAWNLRGANIEISRLKISQGILPTSIVLYYQCNDYATIFKTLLGVRWGSNTLVYLMHFHIRKYYIIGWQLAFTIFNLFEIACINLETLRSILSLNISL